MIRECRYVLLLVVLATLTASFAQEAATKTGPRETLKQYVAELQKSPEDDQLREKIIALVQQLKPQPAIPKEASRPFNKAVTFQKEAKEPSDYDLAIVSYREALLAAPWWPEAYFNLSTAQEGAGKFDDAVRSIKLYLLTKPSEMDVAQAEQRLDSLEAKKELAAKRQREALVKEANDRRSSFEGHWAYLEFGRSGNLLEEIRDILIISKDSFGNYSVTAMRNPGRDIVVSGRQIEFVTGGDSLASARYKLVLSEDGSQLAGECTSFQTAGDIQRMRARNILSIEELGPHYERYKRQ